MSSLWTAVAFWTPGPFEWVVIVVVAILLFGRRLPEVGRSLGRGIVEFKKGLRGVQDEIDEAGDATGDEAPSGPENGAEAASSDAPPEDGKSA